MSSRLPDRRSRDVKWVPSQGPKSRCARKRAFLSVHLLTRREFGVSGFINGSEGIRRAASACEIGVEATAGHPSVPRYLVTYMHSQTGSAIRSATVVSVTNQSNQTNLVTVSYFKGVTNNASPVGVTSFSIPPDFTVDFSSRNLPSELTQVNSVCNPEFVFDEGRAIVSSRRPQIGVSSRIYSPQATKTRSCWRSSTRRSFASNKGIRRTEPDSPRGACTDFVTAADVGLWRR